MRAIPRAFLAGGVTGTEVMKKLSEWQLSRLRDCLRAYHAYGTGNEKVGFNWKDVSQAIDLSTGTTIGPERLRQFVEGINDGAGGRKFPVPKAIDAIWQFVTDDELQLITVEELTEHKPSIQAALRMLEYLDQDFDSDRIIPPAKLQGTYRSRKESLHDVLISEMVLETPTSEGLITVAKTEEYFDHGVADDFAEWSESERRSMRNSRIKYNGWALLTPEDNLMFFLKNERNGRNHYYFTLGSDFDHSENTPVTEMILLAHDYPVERDFENPKTSLFELAFEKTRQNILQFGRVE